MTPHAQMFASLSRPGGSSDAWRKLTICRSPTPAGGVQFEWEAGQRYFEIEIVGERAAECLYCDDAAHVEETGNLFEEESLEQVVAYIRSVGTLQ